MIHVPLSPDELEQLISQAKPMWYERAVAQAEVDRVAGRHVSAQNLWSQIKPVFVAHQRRKCAYCERRLGEAGIEWDVEHFRPKRRVDVWIAPAGFPWPSGGPDDRGYYLLAFDPRNYLVSCKPCNGNHKRNYFPVAGARALTTTDPRTLRAESAYLLHPLDPDEADPELLIDFDGVLALPRDGTSTDERDRARTSIEVLKLNRPDLDFARSEAIMHLWNALQLSQGRHREQAVRTIEAMTGPGAKFTNCARSFVELFCTRRSRADEIGAAATEVVHTHSA